MPNSLFKDETGNVYGRLTVLRVGVYNRLGYKWICLCECGKETEVQGTFLRNGNTRSCGCLAVETAAAREWKHGKSHTKVHRTWQQMWNRCTNANSNSYRNYGERGIKVCDRWREFTNFYEDMGDPPSEDHSIERIDNEGDYTPDNCCWATDKEQCSNRRNNIRVEYDGRTQTLKQWAEELNLNYLAMYRKYIKQKKSIEEAIYFARNVFKPRSTENNSG